ncbi:hypothetical protein WJX81_005133 [Elliptochloris bilobata]|uniref:Uncharacterized protein n=1 Tax=Elliptochloris bilobata TaxID=381761 RepID=A0AAW1QHC9_9CHLO
MGERGEVDELGEVPLTRDTGRGWQSRMESAARLLPSIFEDGWDAAVPLPLLAPGKEWLLPWAEAGFGSCGGDASGSVEDDADSAAVKWRRTEQANSRTRGGRSFRVRRRCAETARACRHMAAFRQGALPPVLAAPLPLLGNL